MSGAYKKYRQWRKDCNDDWDLPTVMYSNCYLSAQHAKKVPNISSRGCCSFNKSIREAQ